MTKEEWEDIAKILNAIYDDGHLMFERGNVKKMQTWYSCLSDLDYKIASHAVRNLAMKSPYKPKISDIRKEYALIVSRPTIGEGEAWAMVRDAIRNGTYGATEEFEKFPEPIKKAVGSPSSLSDWAMMSSDDVETIVQSLFKRAYRAEIERAETDAVLGAIGTKAGAMASIAESVVKQLEGGE